MAHPETLLPMSAIDDPVERFVAVIKFYLSGWHIKPPYVCSTQHALLLFFLPSGDDILIFLPTMPAEASRSP